MVSGFGTLSLLDPKAKPPLKLTTSQAKCCFETKKSDGSILGENPVWCDSPVNADSKTVEVRECNPYYPYSRYLRLVNWRSWDWRFQSDFIK